jgi:hypothetical protein
MADNMMIRFKDNALNMGNERLTEITNDIISHITSMQEHGLVVAARLAEVKDLELWKGTFDSFAEYTEGCFGLKKSQAYKLAAIGRDYVANTDPKAPITSTLYDGCVNMGYENDYSATQLIQLLPLKSPEKAKELQLSGDINPTMSASQIKAVVDENKPPRETSGGSGEGEGDGEGETVHVEVTPEQVLSLKATITIEESAEGIAHLFIDGEQATKKAVMELINGYRYK